MVLRFLIVCALGSLAGIVSFAQSPRFYMDMVDNSVFNGIECNIVETADGDLNVTITNTSNLHYS